MRCNALNSLFLLHLPLWVLLTCSTVARADLTVGAPAPDLVLHAVDGHDYSVANLRGKVVILVFWATWCSPCQQELPALTAFAEEHAAQGVQILGFSLDDAGNMNQVRALAKNLRFPAGLLGSAWAGEYGRIWRIPMTFVIDRSGRLAFDGQNQPGWVWNKEKLNSRIMPLL